MAAPSGVLKVFARAKRELERFAARFVRPSEIDDIVQQALIRSYEAELRGPVRHPRAYMLRTVRNLSINHAMRSDRRLVSLEDCEESGLWSDAQRPDRELEERERFQGLCRAISGLPLQCRRVFVLKKIYGLSQREIAEYLGIRESTVEKHIARGMLLCAQSLYAQGLGEPSSAAKPRRGVRHG